MSKKSTVVGSLLILVIFFMLISSTSYTNPINWKQFEGQTVRVLTVSHPWQQRIEELLDDFTQKTGINVEITVLGEDVYWDRVLLGLSSSTPPFDVFMLSPNQTGFTGYQNGWLEDLDKYINDKTLTDVTYNFMDIYPYVSDGFRFPNNAGKLYGIPLTMEVYMLFYRKDILEELGVDVNSLETIDDWLGVLEEIDEKYPRNELAPAVIRGQDPTMPDELLAAVYNYWGDRPFLPQRMFYFDENWYPRFTDPAVKKGFDLWATLLNYGPVGSTSFTWYDCVQHFASGRAATYWFDASLFASIFEDPKQSAVVGEVGYLPVPPTETGHGTTHWAWGLAMSSKSQTKGASWLFMQWATNPEIEALTAPNTYGPVRASTWKSMQAADPEYAKAVDQSLRISTPGYMYFPGAREVADRIIDAVIKLTQGEDLDATMEWLNTVSEEVVRRNELLK